MCHIKSGVDEDTVESFVRLHIISKSKRFGFLTIFSQTFTTASFLQCKRPEGRPTGSCQYEVSSVSLVVIPLGRQNALITNSQHTKVMNHTLMYSLL